MIFSLDPRYHVLRPSGFDRRDEKGGWELLRFCSLFCISRLFLSQDFLLLVRRLSGRSYDPLAYCSVIVICVDLSMIQLWRRSLKHLFSSKLLELILLAEPFRKLAIDSLKRTAHGISRYSEPSGFTY